MASPVIVVPGDRLGGVDEFSAGEGTYVRGLHVFASALGVRTVIAAPTPSTAAAAPLPTVTVQRSGATSSVPCIPSVGCVVTGRVTSINPRAATVAIVCVGDVAVAHPFSGTLRKENLVTTDIDRVLMQHCVRPGDVILAEVCRLPQSLCGQCGDCGRAAGSVAFQPSIALHSLRYRR